MRNTILETLPEFRDNTGDVITKEYHFEIITPMFGGDANSWELNLEAPIRAQSIRGQLRFWWRTMQSEDDLIALLDKENALWGGRTQSVTGKACRIQSRVKLAVVDQQISASHHAALNDKGNALKDEVIPTYVAFPVTDAIKNKGKDVIYIQEITFTLRISFHREDQETVLNTLKLWTLFGGVGARTRRGCGSLFCAELLENFNSGLEIRHFLTQCAVGPSTPFPYARLSGTLLACASSSDNPATSWMNLLKKYSEFRQDRVPRKPKPGQSFWPEPDAIRRVTQQHSPLHTPHHPDGIWFPRAAFGLPIITKFNTQDNGKGDPDQQIELLPQGHERWPSPVILKVVRLGNNQIFNMVLVLNQRFPDGLRLKQGATDHPLDDSSSPFAPGEHVLKTRQGFSAEGTIHKTLFKALGLEEIQ